MDDGGNVTRNTEASIREQRSRIMAYLDPLQKVMDITQTWPKISKMVIEKDLCLSPKWSFSDVPNGSNVRISFGAGAWALVGQRDQRR